uniref:Uncharacterized protein n=1 Tax=Myotis myotis TaxID=51298 RepID=A0A7J7UPL1_MYOMY|nr:hypothetical protein mMyoMyo1_008537 [Myotis myotis]
MMSPGGRDTGFGAHNAHGPLPPPGGSGRHCRHLAAPTECRCPSPETEPSHCVVLSQSQHFPESQFWVGFFLNIFLFLKYIFIDYREKGEGEAETPMMRENHGSAASCRLPTGDRAHSPDMCPDRELNSDLLVHRSMLNHWATPAGRLTQGLWL